MVVNQFANLTIDLFFKPFNYRFITSNEECEPIFDKYTLRPFQWHILRI